MLNNRVCLSHLFHWVKRKAVSEVRSEGYGHTFKGMIVTIGFRCGDWHVILVGETTLNSGKIQLE